MKRLIMVCLIFLTAPAAFTQPQELKLQVAARLIKPFIFEESGQLTGFSVELWQELAKGMNVKSQSLTFQQLRSEINGPEALPGKGVASIRGSTSVEYLHRRHIAVTEFSNDGRAPPASSPPVWCAACLRPASRG
jgi:ABC-type amino acid transport substrate-binding protein